jgi:hypothetical protein
VQGRSSGCAGRSNGFMGVSGTRCGGDGLCCGSGFWTGLAGAGGAGGASAGAFLSVADCMVCLLWTISIRAPASAPIRSFCRG